MKTREIIFVILVVNIVLLVLYGSMANKIVTLVNVIALGSMIGKDLMNR